MASRSVATWIPQQHGAWAWVLAPTLVGATLAGWTWWHVGLLVSWLIAYAAYATWGRWVRVPPARRGRWVPPLVTYAAVAVLGGVVVVAARPGLAAWSPVYLVLFGVSVLATWRHTERGWVNDTVTTVAACTMTVVAYGLVAASPSWRAGWVPPGAASPRAWLAAGILFAYFFGTVLYVKSVIRERGSVAMYGASVAYHALIASVGWWYAWPLGVVGTLLAVRAAVVPQMRPPVPTPIVGVGEFVATAALAVTVVLVV